MLNAEFTRVETPDPLYRAQISTSF